MARKLKNLIGLKKAEFDAYIAEGEELMGRPARLIPILKPGDEMALTSIFLSSLRLINEFRRDVLSATDMVKGGQLYVFTEISFKDFSDSRLDGLILIVKNGIIKDAAFLEMKNGSNELDVQQVEKYINIAKAFSIPRIITISNQFVSVPTQSPIKVKKPKNITLYHLSWSYILTLAHLLLFENDNNIDDEDQAEIMKEVLTYLEDPQSRVCGFSQMKPGWKDVVDNIVAGKQLEKSDTTVEETVISWHQEERDMALKLSRLLGVLVKSGFSRYSLNLEERLENDIKHLLKHNYLNSVFKIKGAVSEIIVKGLFQRRLIEMSIVLQAPQDKKTRGQLGWLIRQFDKCRKKEEATFRKIEDMLWVDIIYKRKTKFDSTRLKNIETATIKSDQEIKEFRVLYRKDLGKVFASRRKFVEAIEGMLIDYYSSVVQNLTKWLPSAPKINADTVDMDVMPTVVSVPEPSALLED